MIFLSVQQVEHGYLFDLTLKSFCLFVMFLARKNVERIVRNLINKSVLIIDSSRPIAGKLMFKRFRFSNSFKRISCNIFYQFFYSLEKEKEKFLSAIGIILFNFLEVSFYMQCGLEKEI